jgi:NADH-quinone oxidoreductase subunit K
MISVSLISILNFLLFCVGIFGIVFNYSNLLSILMSMELMLLSINLQLIILSLVFDDVTAQIFALLILTIAAAEAAIGLALVVIFYRLRNTVSLKVINLMKG